MSNGVIWLIIFIFTLLIEAITVGLVSIWFTIGSIAAFITSYFTDNIIIEIFVFVVVSIVSLIITRPLAKKYLVKKVTKTNCDTLIGKTGIVMTDITDKDMGTVKVNGQIWSALNKDKGTIIKENEVDILSIEGVKLIVRKKEI